MVLSHTTVNDETEISEANSLMHYMCDIELSLLHSFLIAYCDKQDKKSF
jgi:hypothetical protein